MTARSGTGPQPSGSEQGVVLRGGAHADRQMQAPSFSLPHVAPLNVVPVGQTLASGSGPHSDGSHSRYDTLAFGSGSDQPHEPDAGAHCGLSAFDDDGTSPQDVAVHGATKLRPVRVAPVCSPPVSVFPPVPFGDGGGVVDVLEHATRKRRLTKEERGSFAIMTRSSGNASGKARRAALATARWFRGDEKLRGGSCRGARS